MVGHNAVCNTWGPTLQEPIVATKRFPVSKDTWCCVHLFIVFFFKYIFSNASKHSRPSETDPATPAKAFLLNGSPTHCIHGRIVPIWRDQVETNQSKAVSIASATWAKLNLSRIDFREFASLSRIRQSYVFHCVHVVFPCHGSLF